MDFFEQFEQARWEFTYGAPDNENLNALQVGLVAHFYIDQGYLPEKRQAMAEAFALYHQEFGDKGNSEEDFQILAKYPDSTR